MFLVTFRLCVMEKRRRISCCEFNIAVYPQYKKFKRITYLHCVLYTRRFNCVYSDVTIFHASEEYATISSFSCKKSVSVNVLSLSYNEFVNISKLTFSCVTHNFLEFDSCTSLEENVCKWSVDGKFGEWQTGVNDLTWLDLMSWFFLAEFTCFQQSG